MGRVKKEFDSDGVFQTRFRDLYSNAGITQSTLAEALDVSRPTVAGWLLGKNLPDIISLEKISLYFNVSADYLLGLSNTPSPDVSARAASEYTGLSPEAVEWLHAGLDDFECDGEGISEVEKKGNLNMTSSLIQSKAFTNMIHNLQDVFRSAYSEQIMVILQEHYSEDGSSEYDSYFCFANPEDRTVVLKNLVYVLKNDTYPPLTKEAENEIFRLDDDTLMSCVIDKLLDYRQENELRQFHAAKAFSSYIDYVLNEAHKLAEQRFTEKFKTKS